jgi:hypothetical protein
MADFKNFGGYSDNRVYIIPNDGETREDIESIDRATKEDVRLRHRVFVNMDFESNTIATVYVQSLVKVLYSHIVDNGVHILSKDSDGVLDFYGLIELAATNKKNDQAEKTGNINVKFMPGRKVPEIISDDVPNDQKEVEFIEARAAFTFPEDASLTNAMAKIDRIAQKELQEHYAIIIPNTWITTAVAATFVENIYRYMIFKLKATEKNAIMLNFNDIIEFHAVKRGDGVEFRLRPGFGAKLIIKSDESTEASDDDYDEDGN